MGKNTVKIASGFVFFAKAPGKVAFSPRKGESSNYYLQLRAVKLGKCRSFRRLCTHLLNFLFDDACVCVCNEQCFMKSVLGPDVEKAKIIGVLLQAPRGFIHIAKIGG